MTLRPQWSFECSCLPGTLDMNREVNSKREKEDRKERLYSSSYKERLSTRHSGYGVEEVGSNYRRIFIGPNAASNPFSVLLTSRVRHWRRKVFQFHTAIGIRKSSNSNQTITVVLRNNPIGIMKQNISCLKILEGLILILIFVRIGLKFRASFRGCLCHLPLKLVTVKPVRVSEQYA